jgi:hypothetical protein
VSVCKRAQLARACFRVCERVRACVHVCVCASARARFCVRASAGVCVHACARTHTVLCACVRASACVCARAWCVCFAGTPDPQLDSSIANQHPAVRMRIQASTSCSANADLGEGAVRGGLDERVPMFDEGSVEVKFPELELENQQRCFQPDQRSVDRG